MKLLWSLFALCGLGSACAGTPVRPPSFLIAPASLNALKVAQDIDPGPAPLLISRAPAPTQPSLQQTVLQTSIFTLGDFSSRFGEETRADDVASPLLMAMALETDEVGERIVEAPIWTTTNAARFEELYFRLANVDPDANMALNDGSLFSNVSRIGLSFMDHNSVAAAADATLYFREVPGLAFELYKSVTAFRLRTAERSELPLIYLRLAQICAFQGEYPSALVLFQESIRLQPENADATAWLMLIQTELLTFQPDAARATLAYVQKRLADGAWAATPNVELKLQRIARWMTFSDDVVSHASEPALEHRLRLANARQEMGQGRIARIDVEKLRTEFPRDARPQLLLARIAHGQFRDDEAAELVRTAWDMENLPSDYYKMAVLSWAVRWVGNYYAHGADWLRTKDLELLWPAALSEEWKSRVAPLIAKGDPDRAELLALSFAFGETCFEAPGADPDLSHAFALAEALYLRHRDQEEYVRLVPTAALVHSQQLESFPRLVEISNRTDVSANSRLDAIRSMASVAVRLGKPWMMEEAKGALSSLPSENVDAALLRGNTWALLAGANSDPGYWRTAIQSYQIAVTDEKHDDFDIASNNLGIAYARVGKWDEADALLTRSEEASSNDTTIRLNKAIVRVRVGDPRGLETLRSVALGKKGSVEERYIAATWLVHLGGEKFLNSADAIALQAFSRGLDAGVPADVAVVSGNEIDESCSNTYSINDIDEGYFIFHVKHEFWLTFPAAMNHTTFRESVDRIAVSKSY